MNQVALTIKEAIGTRTGKAAIAGAAIHIAAFASKKFGFDVDVADVGHGIAMLLDTIAVIYFRAQAPVRDNQAVATPRPQD